MQRTFFAKWFRQMHERTMTEGGGADGQKLKCSAERGD
jgi:hypothetical protein